MANHDLTRRFFSLSLQLTSDCTTAAMAPRLHRPMGTPPNACPMEIRDRSDQSDTPTVITAVSASNQEAGSQLGLNSLLFVNRFAAHREEAAEDENVSTNVHFLSQKHGSVAG